MRNNQAPINKNDNICRGFQKYIWGIHHHFVPKREENSMEDVLDRKTIMNEKSH